VGLSPEALYEAALAASAHAYAPYSGLQVGAALQTEAGARYAGANVENASYGLTICAERSVLFAAVSAGERSFARIAVAATRDGRARPASPCGACRQVLAEFGPGLVVVLRGPEGLVERPLADLLPDAFALEP
jgi:cytidine deaminase